MTIFTNRFAWLAFFMALILSFFLASIIHAQSDEGIAQKYGVTFPVAELGNCDSISSCRTYCEDPVNHNSCIDYAKQKGFYQKEATQINKDAILVAARVELGCDSESACMALCNQQANFDKCSSFAQRHDLGGGHVQDPTKGELLEKARQVLGCDTPQTCMNFCKDEVNKAKCSEFAKQTGLRGGEQQVGPGGCSSEETCKAFCSDPQNSQICSEFSRSHGGSYSGPGGCNSEESCKAYCQAHPTECGGGSEERISLQEYCSKTPNCSWTNERCECRSETVNVNYGDYATKCADNGCTWTGSSCQCSSQSGSTYNTPSPTESSTGTTTQSTSNPSPTESTTTSSPAPSEVQGVTTGGGLLQLLLDWLRR